MSKKIGIVYLCWSDEPKKYLVRALQGIIDQLFDKNNIRLVIVYNSHKENEESSFEFIKKTVEEMGEKLPQVELIESESNLGFVGGNNKGMIKAMDMGCDYVMLHNADGFLDTNAVSSLFSLMENDSKIGVAQSLVLLYPDKDKINTAGNKYLYLGFGYSGEYLETREKVPNNGSKQVSYVSGAAVMMRTELLKKYGLWDYDYYFYHDDLEYSMRLKSLGYLSYVCYDSIFYHEYSFSRNKDKYYLLERNRFLFVLTYYKIPTILLILPMFIILESALLVFSVIDGWFLKKLKAYGFFLCVCNWKMILQKRKEVQKRRKYGDKELLEMAVGYISFKDINNFVLKYIGNPLMEIYWFIIKKIIIW